LLSREVKELLYRPPKIKKLYDKYWELNSSNRSRLDAEKLKEGRRGKKATVIYKLPKKTEEEYKLIDKIIVRL
jgi:hypothetical protein